VEHQLTLIQYLLDQLVLLDLQLYNSLAAGTFTVTVRDANACTYTTTTVVGNTAGPTAVTLTPVNTSCGGTTGTLTIGAVTGGTSAFTYSVSPGPAGFNATTSFTGLGAATYTVIVQDANGCQTTSTSVVGNNPGPTAVVLTPVNSTCGASNGSFTIGAVTGGTGRLYLFSKCKCIYSNNKLHSISCWYLHSNSKRRKWLYIHI
jgi:hypothetical protein